MICIPEIPIKQLLEPDLYFPWGNLREVCDKLINIKSKTWQAFFVYCGEDLYVVFVLHILEDFRLNTEAF